jgi:hypothetical protein
VTPVALTGLKAQIGRKSSERKITLSEVEMRDFGVCVKATVGTTSHSPINSLAIPTVFTIFRQGEFPQTNALSCDEFALRFVHTAH